MNERLVTSLSLSKELKEAGCKQKSEFYWYLNKLKNTYYISDNFVISRPEQVERIASAYLTGELGEMLPYHWHSYKYKTTCGNLEWCCSSSDVGISAMQTAKIEPEARGKMLLYLLKQGGVVS